MRSSLELAARRIRELVREAGAPPPERFVVVTPDPLVIDGLETEVRLEDGDDDLDAGAVQGVRLSAGDVLYVQPEAAGDGLEWTVVSLNAGDIPNATRTDVGAVQDQLDALADVVAGIVIGGGGDKTFQYVSPTAQNVHVIDHGFGRVATVGSVFMYDDAIPGPTDRLHFYEETHPTVNRTVIKTGHETVKILANLS